MSNGDIDEKVYGDATPDQIRVIDHIGNHARLLAGPGTGKTKTLTRRVLSLVLKHQQNPELILLLTFTRLAAAQLRLELSRVLEPLKVSVPHVSTLHSFALRQILRNSSAIDALPRPIRIADDWEERHIIQEDLKRTLSLSEIREVRSLINQLSTDWETLRIDEEGWERQFPNPQFLGAWRTHRDIYGETLRAELVYQLKKQLSQNRDFRIEEDYRYILIDEYQDLNACDLAIIRELANRSAEIFVAGDDDQSIYGFRYANPVGIRQFPEIYTNTKRLSLEICFRCDKNILQAGEFVASLDPARLPKPTHSQDTAGDGEVLIINFRDQAHEAIKVAEKIRELVESGILPKNIAVLLRSDMNEAMSNPLINAIKEQGIEVSLPVESILERSNEYRIVLSLLRLLVDVEDNLAWRTLLEVEKNRIGIEAIKAIEAIAQSRGIRFKDAMFEIKDNPSVLSRFGQRIAKFVEAELLKLENIKAQKELDDILTGTIKQVSMSEVIKGEIVKFFEMIRRGEAITGVDDLVREISSSSERIQQEIVENAVNILTMHQAKGLTFDVCFIVGAEDEVIPGRNTGEKEGDERRLLYVSMTRAKHKLFITYCTKRIGQQMFLGRESGNPRRTLTKFLRDSKIKVIRA